MSHRQSPPTAVIPAVPVDHPPSPYPSSIVFQPILYPASVTAQRPRPRIAKGFFVLLVSGVLGLIVFAMGQTVWGAIWRGWLGTILVALVIALLL